MSTPEQYTDTVRHDPLAEDPRQQHGDPQLGGRSERAGGTDPTTAAAGDTSGPRHDGDVLGGTDRDARSADPATGDRSGSHSREHAGSPEAGATAGGTTQAGSATHADSSSQTDSDGRERLVPVARAESYGSRWNEVKGMFVDEPRQAVAQADALVGELLDELERLFREQRRGIEQGLDTDETSTEDLRLALRRYRSFFDRLLSL